LSNDPWAGDPWAALKTEPGTYAHVLASSFLSKEEKREVEADSTLGHAATLLLQRGKEDVVRLLLDVIKVVIELDEYYDFLWLEVAPEHLAQFEEGKVETIKDACEEVSRRFGYGISWGGVREAITEVGPEWRDHLRQRFYGGKRPTNNGHRVRTADVRIMEDHLAFTNDGERTVYRALRKLQESFPSDETFCIFPLAGGRVPGRTWEPDVLVTYKNRAGVLEIDGPHHNARRALDVSREHLLHDAGVGFVDRVPVEALSDPDELDAVLRRFLKRVAETR
jgi:hypothetical protein